MRSLNQIQQIWDGFLGNPRDDWEIPLGSVAFAETPVNILANNGQVERGSETNENETSMIGDASKNLWKLKFRLLKNLLE